MSFVDLKARSRRTVHAVFAVPCTLQNTDGTWPLSVRLHDRIVTGGDLNSEGFAGIIEGVQRAVFSREELGAADDGIGVVPERGDILTFPDYLGLGQDVVLELDARDPYDGPITEKWSVTPHAS